MKKNIQFNIMYFLAALLLLLAVENYFLARNVALKILTERREALRQIAAVLLQKEVIEGQELKDLLKQRGAA